MNLLRDSVGFEVGLADNVNTCLHQYNSSALRLREKIQGLGINTSHSERPSRPPVFLTQLTWIQDDDTK